MRGARGEGVASFCVFGRGKRFPEGKGQEAGQKNRREVRGLSAATERPVSMAVL